MPVSMPAAAPLGPAVRYRAERRPIAASHHPPTVWPGLTALPSRIVTVSVAIIPLAWLGITLKAAFMGVGTGAAAWRRNRLGYCSSAHRLILEPLRYNIARL